MTPFDHPSEPFGHVLLTKSEVEYLLTHCNEAELSVKLTDALIAFDQNFRARQTLNSPTWGKRESVDLSSIELEL